MVDKIDDIIDRAIQYTREILTIDTQHWPIARKGLEKMLSSLDLGLVRHPAVDRLREFITDQNGVYDGDGSRH